jgi:hypothetical protein
MLESDDDLVDTIKEMQEARGRGEKFNPRQLHEKIEVIGPAINLDKLARSIDVEILESLGASWDHWFGMLQKFHEREGHCRVDPELEVNGLRLGIWVQTQRTRKDQLTPDRIRRLDCLGFSWDPREDDWEEAFNLLRKIRDKQGHCRIAQKLNIDGVRLGSWVNRQRNLYAKNQVEAERFRRLSSLGFSWDPLNEQWDEAFEALQKFHKREGHCRAPKGFKENGISLGRWVNKQRSRKDLLSPIRVQRLNSIGFTWDLFEDQWEKSFNELTEFQRSNGHCRVPYKLVVRGTGLGTWVNLQRQKRGELSEDQINRLDSLGFSWDPRTEQWDQGFEALQKFHKREGHCRVPKGFEEDGIALGSWVTTQRRIKDEQPIDRIKRLESVGFCWDPFIEQWEKAFTFLQRFHSREGHCRVSQQHNEDGFNLGRWVHGQRNRKGRLAADQIAQLDHLGFTWDPHNDDWEDAFSLLRKIRGEQGHCRISQKFILNGLNLGLWVRRQRDLYFKKQLDPERVRRLESLNFSWDPLTERWDEAFEALQKFHNREGHCRVTYGHLEDGINLSRWVVTQRQIHGNKKLTPDKISRLNTLNFKWNPRDEQWDEAFDTLQVFFKREGHCQVPREHTENGLKLGTWVGKQKEKKDRLPPDRVKRLDSLGFTWKR